MKNTNDIIRSLDCCSRAGGTCEGCAYDGANGPECTMRLLADAHDALIEMKDRCARYAEEIMALRELAEADKDAEAALADKLQKAKDQEKKASDRVVEMEKALELKRDQDRRRVEELEKQLALADPDTAVFKTWFAAIQQDFLRLREAESQVSGRDSEKGQKLRTAVRALLQQQEGVWE